MNANFTSMTQVVEWVSKPVYYIDASTGMRYCKGLAHILGRAESKRVNVPVQHKTKVERTVYKPVPKPIKTNPNLTFLGVE